MFLSTFPSLRVTLAGDSTSYQGLLRSDALCHSEEMKLDTIQARVLGALIEKEIATPENYPLSLNSLLLACNQRSSREPVMDLVEDQVRQAVHRLEELKFTAPVHDGRVAKYEHRIRTVLNLRRDETAILCLLLLRGPQTPGEIRSRADRLYRFDDPAAVQATLERMASRPAAPSSKGVDVALNRDAAGSVGDAGPLVVLLPRQPGSRESRYAHLLGGPVESAGLPKLLHEATSHPRPSGEPGTTLAVELQRMQQMVSDLEERVGRLEANNRSNYP